ncbi:MAG: 2-keto-4-pentenoate hydratase [delta proteobacterium ML8_F1]|nr:MAG: 2-keto-4-pentenoate hydratase [delta proteobacterium ML8_F1]
MSEHLKAISEALYDAQTARVAMDPVVSKAEGLTVEDAYRIQLLNVDRRLEEGRKIVGKKIGLTSLAMQNMLGVDQPDYGHLLDDMIVENHEIERDRMLQPKVEAEIAFVLKENLVGPGVTVEDVHRATDYVLASFEIVDSRIRDWQIGLVDTVADNASSGVFVLGTNKVALEGVDLKAVEMSLYKNGELVNTGNGAAALGDPAYCVAWLANKMHEFGIVLKKGEIILSGALSAALTAEKGDRFRADFSVLGTVEVVFI